jgi:SAM-dependent methyltransferase
MNEYAVNRAYWNKGYFGPNVESLAFRFYGRILRSDFDLPQRGSRLLDFGCGMGAATNFFQSVGFDVKGVDISDVDINKAKDYFPAIRDCVSVVSPSPGDNPIYGWPSDIDVVYACQSLYYWTRSDFYLAIQKLYESMKTGGIFFATFKTPGQWDYYKASTETADPWLRRVRLKNSRLDVDVDQFFVKDEEDLVDRLSMFRPIHTGYYTMQLRSDESDGHHLIFCGVKD